MAAPTRSEKVVKPVGTSASRSKNQTPDNLAESGGLAAPLQRRPLDPRSVTPGDVQWLQRVAGNRAVGQMLAAQQAARPAPLPSVQRTVVLKQLEGSQTTVANVQTLINWLSRFGITLDRQPLRQIKLYVMHDAETIYTYPWNLAGGDDAQRFINDLDSLTYFPGAEFTVPWLPEFGYAFFEQMQQEAPRVFVSEERFRYVIEKFRSNAISSQLLTAASEQAVIQAPTPKNSERFRWICENLTLEMLVQQLTTEKLSLLMALQQNLAIAPTTGLLALVDHCGADNALRGILFECLKAKIEVDALTTGLLDVLKPFASQFIGLPSERTRFVSEKYLNGALSSQLLAAAFAQVIIQSPTPKNFERFCWICENLTVEMLAQQLSVENLTLLTALQQQLGIAPSTGLLVLVDHCGSDNPLRGLLYESLVAKIEVGALTNGLLDLLNPFAGQLLGHPDLLVRACDVALTEPGELATYAPFNFSRQTYLKAAKYANQQAKSYRDTETEALNESVESEQAKALASFEEQAKTELSGKHKAGLNQPTGSEKFKNAKAALESGKQELAAGKFAEIESNRLKRESEISSETEAREKEALEAYRDYLSDPLVKHHPLAIAALELLKFNFDLAKQLVAAIAQAPIIGQLVIKPELSVLQINRCLTGLSTAALANILGLLTQKDLIVFATKTDRLAVLAQLELAGVNGPILKQFAAEISSFDTYCASSSATRFAQLITVQHYSLSDILKCLNETTSQIGTPPARVVLIASIAQHAQTAAALRQFLHLAQRVDWNTGQITNALNGLGNGLAGSVLCDAIYEGLLAGLGQAILRKWLDALEVPVEDGWAVITKGDEEDLGIGNSGSRTLEIPCTVKRKSNGQVLLTFVIHSHPGAQVSTSNPWGSKKHVKPDRWSTTERLPFNESLGKSIYKAIGGS